MGKKNVPELRFKGFSGDWERKKYDETFVSISNNTLSRADLNYNSGLAKNIHYGDVLIKFGELLDAKKEEIPFITDDSLANKFGTSKLQNGDVIIADAAEDETVGKCTELVNIKNETIVSGLHTIPVRPVQFFASGYLGYYMNSPAYHGQLLRLMQGTKVSSISKTALQDTIIVYPNNNDEQTAIGAFFRSLDALISLQSQKLGKLVTMKKAMLSKMFPKDGETVPELRFKGFSGEWERKKLGECFSERSERSAEGELISVTINSGIRKFSELNRHDNSNDDKSKYKKVEIGDIAYNSMRMWQGASGYSSYKGILSPAYTVLVPLSETDSLFFSYMFKKPEMIHIFQINSQGITSDNWNLKYPVISEVDLITPTLPEQTSIGSFFQNFDTLITLQKQELEKLKTIKKSLLSKMFV